MSSRGEALFRVEQPGLLTTVQDRGRVGWQRDGVATAGAMDPFAAQVANILVANIPIGGGRGAAVLEITLRGPTLTTLADTRVAVCGADLSAHLGGAPLPLWRTVDVARGQTLGFGPRRSGTRAFLAVAGGFDAPPVLGSRAADGRGGFGGLAGDGRSLRVGDVLRGTPFSGRGPGRALAPDAVPSYETPTVARVVPGPHGAAFDESAWEALLSSEYEISPRSDRMGYRLEGPPLEYADDFSGSVLSEAMPWGGLQVPPDGRPILLMADRQTVGGYPLIGVVASVDLPRVAQAGPGDAMAFRAISAEEAGELWAAQERLLRLLAAGA